MSGKHDKSGDEEQPANLLATGPIVIRGLGRGVKDAFRPGRPSRHRAFVSAEPEPVASDPTEQTEHDAAQAFPATGEVPQTDPDAGSQEDRVNDRADDAPPADTDVEQPGDGTGERSADQSTPPTDEHGAAAELDSSDKGLLDPGIEASVADESDADRDADAHDASPDLYHSATDAGPDAQADITDTSTAAAVAVAGPDAGAVADDPAGEREAGEQPAEPAVDDATEPVEPEPAVDLGPGDEAEPMPSYAEEPTGEEPEDPADAAPSDVPEQGEPALDEDNEADSVATASPGTPDLHEEQPGDVVAEQGEHPVDTDAQVDAGAAREQAEPTDDAIDDRGGQPEGGAEVREPDEQEPDGQASLESTISPNDSAETSPERAEDAIDDWFVPEPDRPDSEPEAAEAQPGEEAPGSVEGDEAAAATAAPAEPFGEPDDVQADEFDERGDAAEAEPPLSFGDGEAPLTDAAVEALPREEVAPEVVVPEASSDEEPAEAVQIEGTLPNDSSADEVSTGEARVDAAAADEASRDEAGTDDASGVDAEAGDRGSNGEWPVEAGADEFGVLGADDLVTDGPAADEVRTDSTDIDEAGADVPGGDVEPDQSDALADELDDVDDADDDTAFGDDPADADIEPEPVDAEQASDGHPAADERDDVLAELRRERGWTTAEELFSRPITLPSGPGSDGGPESAPSAEPRDEPAEATASDTGALAATTPPAAPEPADTSTPEQTASDPDWVAAEHPAKTAIEPASADREEEPQRDAAPAADEVNHPATAETPRARAAAPVPPAPVPPRGPQQRRPRPLRERFGRETIGIAVLVVLALICAGLITAVVVKTQNDARIAAAEAANYTPPPLAAPTPVATGPVVAVIGDGTTSSAGSVVASSGRWSALVGKSLGGSVTTDAADGMGYATKGSSGETFVQEAAKVPSDADVVVFFGGAADANVSTLSLAKAATDAFAAAKKQATDAKILVVGPVIDAGVSTADLTSIRNTLSSAARITKATWVDPIDASWLSDAKQSSSSPSALTASDEKTIATKMEATLKSALR